MRLQELLEQSKDKPEPGTYAAVTFSQATVDDILRYIKTNNIPNAISPEKMHCTVLYSRKYCPDYVPMGTIDPPWVGTPTGLEVWESRGKNRDEDPSRCLVMKFTCDELTKRHNQLMKEHNATYDFPEYKTHITLSYNIGDMDIANLPSVNDTIPVVEIVEEYGEDLDLDWAAKNAK